MSACQGAYKGFGVLYKPCTTLSISDNYKAKN